MKAWDAKRMAQLPQWQQKVMECRSGGMSVKEWCAGEGICPKTYYRWERLVLEAAGKQLAECEALQEKKAMPRFAELPAPQKLSASMGTVEATIHMGMVTVDIHPGASAEVIAAICRGLGHAE